MWSTRSCVRRLYRAAAGVEFVRVKSQGPMSSPSRVRAGRGAPASSANVGSRSRCDVKRFDTPGTIRPGQRRRPNMRWPPSQAVNLPPRYGPCDRVPNASERLGCWPLSDVATTNVLSARFRRSSVCRTCARGSVLVKRVGGPIPRRRMRRFKVKSRFCVHAVRDAAHHFVDFSHRVEVARKGNFAIV